MSQGDDDLEIVSENGATSDEWVKEGSSEAQQSVTIPLCNNNNNETSVADSPLAKKTGDKNCLEIEPKCSASTPPQSTPRHELWVNLLGVRNKPDPLMDWDHLYNLANQSALRRDCRALIDKLVANGLSSSVTVPQLESMITLNCKKRSVDYDPNNGWLDIFAKLVVLPFEQSMLFNVFYAITTKYVPKTTKIYDLFRLLMQYHDPELCSHLDSVKIQPEEYAGDWFRTLLAKDSDTNLCWTIWDQYFDRGDPFLIFFIALVFMMTKREQILALHDKREIVELLKNSLRQMCSDDVSDLLDICFVYLSYTPLSVREDFHCMLFGSNLVDEYSEFPLNRLMCLPISVQELNRRVIDGTSSAAAVFNYFVIDTRTQKAFNAGSIPGSYNLNGKLIVDEPDKFNIAMSSLIKFKEDCFPKDHVCFIGSGLEEDDSYMMMVISRYLHKSIEHISYVDGGYKALHSMLNEIGSITKLSNHFNPHDCLECSSRGYRSAESRGWSLMEKMKKAIHGRKEAVKSKVVQGLQPNTSSIHEDNLKHVNSTDRRFGKRYRNLQSVFTINESSHEGSDEDNLNMSDVETPTKPPENLKWEDVVRKPEIIEHFQGHEMLTADRTQIPCYLALTRTHMHIFHAAKDAPPGYVRSSLRHSLSSIMKVTSKRRFPEYLTFKFGYELPTGEAHINRVHCFVLPKAGECAKAVKTAIIALKPSLVSDDDEEE